MSQSSLCSFSCKAKLLPCLYVTFCFYFCVCLFLLQNRPKFMKLVNIFVFFVFILVDGFSFLVFQIHWYIAREQAHVGAQARNRLFTRLLPAGSLRSSPLARMTQSWACSQANWYRDHRKSLTVTENFFHGTTLNLRKKTLVNRPPLRRNFSSGTQRVIPSGQDDSILPARVGSQRRIWFILPAHGVSH